MAEDGMAPPFQFRSLTGFANDARVQAEPIHPSAQMNRGLVLQRRHTVERQRLAACVLAYGDTVDNGSCLNLIEA